MLCGRHHSISHLTSGQPLLGRHWRQRLDLTTSAMSAAKVRRVGGQRACRQRDKGSWLLLCSVPPMTGHSSFSGALSKLSFSPSALIPVFVSSWFAEALLRGVCCALSVCDGSCPGGFGSGVDKCCFLLCMCARQGAGTCTSPAGARGKCRD